MTDSTTAEGWIRKKKITRPGKIHSKHQIESTHPNNTSGYLWMQKSRDKAKGSLGRKIISRMLSLKIGIMTVPHSPTPCAHFFPDRCQRILK
jgi:hypothetical protein